jgi:similar to spore coat protein
MPAHLGTRCTWHDNVDWEVWILNLGYHEALDLHAILGLKTNCASRSASMAQLVSDQALRGLLQKDVRAGTQHAQQLQGLLQGATRGGR